MQRNNLLKKLFTLTSLACFGISVLLCPATTITVQAAVIEETVEPCSDVIEWRYKIEGNSLYRRLYNASRAIWLTEWLYVGEIDQA